MDNLHRLLFFKPGWSVTKREGALIEVLHAENLTITEPEGPTSREHMVCTFDQTLVGKFAVVSYTAALSFHEDAKIISDAVTQRILTSENIWQVITVPGSSNRFRFLDGWVHVATELVNGPWVFTTRDAKTSMSVEWRQVGQEVICGKVTESVTCSDTFLDFVEAIIISWFQTARHITLKVQGSDRRCLWARAANYNLDEHGTWRKPVEFQPLQLNPSTLTLPAQNRLRTLEKKMERMTDLVQRQLSSLPERLSHSEPLRKLFRRLENIEGILTNTLLENIEGILTNTLLANKNSPSISQKRPVNGLPQEVDSLKMFAESGILNNAEEGIEDIRSLQEMMMEHIQIRFDIVDDRVSQMDDSIGEVAKEFAKEVRTLGDEVRTLGDEVRTLGEEVRTLGDEVRKRPRLEH
ncbi:MAG: hypothetical protein KVP17_004513 [Porospora cf. gigantea B]|uniref:uncharacterized protein n=1 Tax=Porospora cf. gigantea B TaxID=2853592 RepID=UPI003571FBE3|nr:MAG: hypothetical protein KVP17_004513 [Porospora cf. gigantea B]